MKAFEHTPYEVNIKWRDIAKALGSWAVDTVWRDHGVSWHEPAPIGNHRVPFEDDSEVLPPYREDPLLYYDMGIHPTFHQHDTFQD